MGTKQAAKLGVQLLPGTTQVHARVEVHAMHLHVEVVHVWMYAGITHLQELERGKKYFSPFFWVLQCKQAALSF